MPVSRPIRPILLAAAVAVVLVQPALAQNSARIFGVVTDHEGNPVDGATVLMEFQGGLTRSFQTSSNDRGEYIQVGLASGPYLVTITAEGIGVLRYNLRLSAGEEFELDAQVLGRGQIDRTGMSAEEIAEMEARDATADAFAGGLDAARGGDFDEAARLLAEAIEVTPDCGECLRNLGIVEFQRGNYDEAEQALRRATEIAPDDAAAFDALADVYNTQRRFDEAGEASAEATRLSGGAAGGGDAGAVVRSGTDRLERRAPGRRARPVRADSGIGSEPRRGPLLARDGEPQRGPDGRGGRLLADLRGTGAGRPLRGPGERADRAARAVGGYRGNCR